MWCRYGTVASIDRSVIKNNSSKIMTSTYFRNFHQSTHHNKCSRNQQRMVSNKNWSDMGWTGKNELKREIKLRHSLICYAWSVCPYMIFSRKLLSSGRTTPHRMIWHGMVWYSMVWYLRVRHRMIRYGMMR